MLAAEQADEHGQMSLVEHHLAAARRFYESVGAVAYLRRADMLLLREAT